MSGKRKIIWIAVTVGLLAGAGVAAYSLAGRAELQALPGDTLVARLETASAKELDPIIFELAARGDVVVPPILKAFDHRASDPQVQVQLAESVYRMRPTPKTVQALAHMVQKAAGPEAKQRIRSLYEDQRLRCREMPVTAGQESP